LETYLKSRGKKHNARERARYLKKKNEKRGLHEV